MIALAGIVTRDSIILVDFIGLAVQLGRSLFDAIMESRVVRLRPILLTAGAAMLSSIPITLDPIFSGLGWSLIFELLVGRGTSSVKVQHLGAKSNFCSEVLTSRAPARKSRCGSAAWDPTCLNASCGSRADPPERARGRGDLWDTPEEALTHAVDALETVIISRMKHKMDIPDPSGARSVMARGV
jgi:AcrB/AcrD/AcrF family